MNAIVGHILGVLGSAQKLNIQIGAVNYVLRRSVVKKSNQLHYNSRLSFHFVHSFRYVCLTLLSVLSNCNLLKGLSLSDTEPVRASVVGAPPTKQVNNVKTIDRAVGSINVSHAPQVDTSVRSKPVVSKVGKKSTVVIASDAKELIGTETETNVASSSIGTKTGALVQESNLEVGIKAIRSKSPCLKGVKTENDLPVLHNELDDQKAFEFYVTSLLSVLIFTHYSHYHTFAIENQIGKARWPRHA
mgnify:CR=1 FL=1